MEQDKLEKKVVVIQEITDKEKQFRLRCDDNRSYSFWKNKQDGSETRAYQDFKSQELKAGSKIGICYKDNDWQNADGKTITSHNILMFDPADDIQYSSENIVHQKQKVRNETPDWEKIAEGKVRHGIVCALIQAGQNLEEIKLKLPAYTDLVMNGVFQKSIQDNPDVALPEDADGDEVTVNEVKVDDIPF